MKTSTNGANRFADVRNTIQGKQEERLPFFAFAFPEWFAHKYPKAYRNFRKNADKLTTPFDVHRTLQDVLDLKNTGIGDLNQRSISLFSEVFSSHPRLSRFTAICRFQQPDLVPMRTLSPIGVLVWNGKTSVCPTQSSLA